MAVPAWAHYRKATVSARSCGTCDFFSHGVCEMFGNTPVEKDYVCDKWSGRIEKVDTDSRYASEWDQDSIAQLAQLTEAIEPGQIGKATKAGRLFLISHAKTRYNQPGQPHGDRVQGWKNVSLDAQGHKQAEALGRHFKKIGLDELHSSDLARAKQTAQIIGRITGVKDQPATKFRPWNLGSFAGHSSADVVPKLKPYLTDKADQPVDGGESFDTFKDRFLPALEALLKKVDAGKTIGLVTHSRNVELAQGWLGGQGYRSKIDTKAISTDDIDPATVIEIAPGHDGKLRMGEPSVISKAQAHPMTVHLRVTGVSRTPSGQRVYRMVTREGHYVGRTNPTRVRARRGDILKVEANDFLQDSQGDLRWDNPNVVSHYNDAPHSWRELQALAGGTLHKDGAPGDAGDMPPAGDMGSPAEAAIGPTLNSVHVNAPLPNISVAYAGKRLRYRIDKADRWKQLVYGPVLEPNSLDAQDDYMLPDHVEKAAHGYLKRAIRGTGSVAKLQHRRQGFRKTKPSIVPVESFIAPVDFSYDGKEMIKKGTWVMCMHVEDPTLWQDFLEGKYTGFSIGGSGIRRSMSSVPELMPYIGTPQATDWHPQPHPDAVGQRLI